MFYTYILGSLKDKELYIGSTNDLKRRIQEHNSGEVFSTKTRKPFKLLYYEAYSLEKEARLREISLKSRGQARIQVLKRIKLTIDLLQKE